MNDMIEGVELLGRLDPTSLEFFLNHPEVHCVDLARAMGLAEVSLRQYILAHLCRVRRQRVEGLLTNELAAPPLSEESPLWPSALESEAILLHTVAALESQGCIVVMVDPVLAESEMENRRLYHHNGRWRFRQSDAAATTEDPPFFDLRTCSPAEVIRYWVTVANSRRVDGPLVVDAFLDRVQDPFTRLLIETSLDDSDDKTIRELADCQRQTLLDELSTKVEMIVTAFGYCQTENARLKVSQLLAGFIAGAPPTTEEVLFSPCPPLTLCPLRNLASWLLGLARQAQEQGILDLENRAHLEPDPLLRKGIHYVVDGWDSETLTHILRVRGQRLLQREEIKMYMMVDIAHALRHGTNPRMLAEILLAHLPEPALDWETVCLPK